MSHIQISTIIPSPRAFAFDLLTAPEKLESLLADKIEVQLIQKAENLRRGAEYQFMMTRFGMTQPVRLRVEDYLKGSRLTYRQTEGLFREWIHTLKFEDHGENQTLVTEFLEYKVPFGLFGYLADDLFLRRDLKRLLEGRLERAKEQMSALNPA